MVGITTKQKRDYSYKGWVKKSYVFKEYTNIISLMYYGFMAWFIAIINELPRINFNVFNISIIRKAISSLISKGFDLHNKMFLGNVKGIDNMYSNDKLKKSNLLLVENRNNKGRSRTSGSAALKGLYAHGGSSSRGRGHYNPVNIFVVPDNT